MSDNIWRHNWMYSMIPVSTAGDYPNTIIPILAGYCKNCNTAVTQRMHIWRDGSYRLTNMDIPKYGCVGPEG